MKINSLKINGFGKIKDKELYLGDGINVIFGKNEAGKSSILKFITSMLYGASKNKNGREISDFEKHPVNKKFSEYISRDKRGAFYKKHFSNPESQFFVNEARFSPTLKETVNMIHECGGKAFLAHSFAYGLENTIDFIEWAIEQGIDGIEKFYTSHTQEHERIIDNIANTKKIYISGGSDFHGPNVKSEIQLGVGTGNLDISSFIIEPWHPIRNISVYDRKDKCEEKVE